MAYKEEWIHAQEAARILSSNTDHTVTEDYVRLLARNGKIVGRKIEGQEDEYLKIDIEQHRVMTHLSLKVKFRDIATRSQRGASAKDTPPTE